MRNAIVALVIALFLAAESATIVVDNDGFRPRAFGALVSDTLANSPAADDDRRKLEGAGITHAIIYPDSSVAALRAQRHHRARGLHFDNAPLYQLNAAWRI